MAQFDGALSMMLLREPNRQLCKHLCFMRSNIRYAAEQHVWIMHTAFRFPNVAFSFPMQRYQAQAFGCCCLHCTFGVNFSRFQKWRNEFINNLQQYFFLPCISNINGIESKWLLSENLWANWKWCARTLERWICKQSFQFYQKNVVFFLSAIM